MSLDLTLSKRVMTNVAHVNITHNLNDMAEEAGLYEFLWHPEDHGITTAEELILPLQAGIARMKADPERFKAFNPTNGWGSYEGFITVLEQLLLDCQKHPDAKVHTWI